MTLLWAFRWPLAALALVLVVWGTYRHMQALEARATAAETRASVAEAKAELTTAAKDIEVRHEVAIASLPVVPVYARGLRRMCESADRVRPAATAGDHQATPDAEAGVPALEDVATDIRASEADDERHAAAVDLLDLIYEANPQ